MSPASSARIKKEQERKKHQGKISLVCLWVAASHRFCERCKLWW